MAPNTEGTVAPNTGGGMAVLSRAGMEVRGVEAALYPGKADKGIPVAGL